MKLMLCIMVGWLALGYGVGYYWGYDEGYTNALTQLKERLDEMDEEEGYIVYEENPKWNI